VHDELVYEIRTDRVAELGEKIKEVMEAALPAKDAHDVPILAQMKTGADWGSMEEA
jgi:DNA polymerase I-like protein with 3'-5' exonuclease and polymerase domains